MAHLSLAQLAHICPLLSSQYATPQHKQVIIAPVCCAGDNGHASVIVAIRAGTSVLLQLTVVCVLLLIIEAPGKGEDHEAVETLYPLHNDVHDHHSHSG